MQAYKIQPKLTCNVSVYMYITFPDLSSVQSPAHWFCFQAPCECGISILYTIMNPICTMFHTFPSNYKKDENVYICITITLPVMQIMVYI